MTLSAPTRDSRDELSKTEASLIRSGVANLEDRTLLSREPDHTTIGEIFKHEILFIKFFGGLSFDRLRVFAIAYRLAALSLARYLESSHSVDYSRMRSGLGALNTVNIKWSSALHHLMTNVVCLASLVVDARHKDIFKTVLSKRLDKRYLSGPDRTDTPTSPSRHAVLQAIDSNSNPFSGSKVKILRKLLVINLVVTTATSFISANVLVNLRDSLSPNNRDQINPRISNATIPVESQSFSPTTIQSTIFIGLFQLLIHFLHAAFNICQLYDTMLVDFMVSAALTDMMTYSATFDGLSRHEGVDRARFYRASITTGRALEHHPRWIRNRMLTFDLLIQIRDVLLVLSKASNMNYLLVLIYDICRQMSILSLLSAILVYNQVGLSALIVLDYSRILFNMLFCRLGIYWIHNEARRLRFKLAERSLLSELDKSNSARITSDLPSVKRSEIVTTGRLAGQIEHIWPCDWFKPDLKSYFTHNFLVVTLVATLQQIVEVGTKSD